jgi:phage protein D
MSLLGAILDPGLRQPASCLIEVGPDARDLGTLAALVTSVEITTSRTEATTGSIVIEDRRKEDGQWIGADSGLFSRWSPIKVSADFGTRVDEIFRGYITQIVPSYPNTPGLSTLELEVQDESAALDREHMRTLWGEEAPVTDLDILDALVAPLGLSRHARSAQGQSSRVLAQDATPIQFLRERARANGYELIFARGEVYFGPRRLEGQAQAPIMVFAGRATNCLTFDLADDALMPDQVRFDHAPQNEGTTPITETLTPDLPVLGHSLAASEGADLGTPSVWRVTKVGDETEEELRARAQALVNDCCFKIRGNGELDGSLYGRVLEVGRTVVVDGAGGRYGGLYYVEQVVHRFTPQGYRQIFELSRNGTGETAGPSGPISAAASAIAGLF